MFKSNIPLPTDEQTPAETEKPPPLDFPGPTALTQQEHSENGTFGRLLRFLWPLWPSRQQSKPPKAHYANTHDRALLFQLSAQARSKVFDIAPFFNKRVGDVSIPSSEIVAVPCDITMADLVREFRTSKLTRLPVYDNTLDKPMGFVHLKDFALHCGFASKKSKKTHAPLPNNDANTRAPAPPPTTTKQAFSLDSLMRPLLYIPPSMKIGVLLQQMQNKRMHIALVIDEYGGVDGLVTIEDVIEQLIGEIDDEHDTTEEQLWRKESDGTYWVLARALLTEFEDTFGIALALPDSDDEIDTLGGLVFVLAGHVPVRGEVIEHPNGTIFEVIDADPRRIKRLRVHQPHRRLSNAANAANATNAAKVHATVPTKPQTTAKTNTKNLQPK